MEFDLHPEFRVPILDNASYESLLSTQSRDDLVEAFSEVLMRDRNKPLPFKPYKEGSVRSKFLHLLDNPPEWLSGNVVMKHEDYGFPIGECLGITQLGSYANSVSDFFHRDSRMRCGGYNRVSPWDAWNGGAMSDDEWRKVLKGLLSPLFRSVNDLRRVTPQEYRFCFRLGSTVYSAAQFKVHVASQIIREFATNGRVLDFSMGWGDRLAGFFASPNATLYCGTDPNTSLHAGYAQQREAYSAWCNNNFLETWFLESPAEDVDWSQFKDIGLIFTSPPYFSTEKYALGALCESQQSWSRYPEYADWFQGFLETTLRSACRTLIPGGFLALNIFDVDMGKARYPVCKDLYRVLPSMGMEYVGYLGMRMKQRPKNISCQDSAREYMSAYYAEPVWMWRKK